MPKIPSDEREIIVEAASKCMEDEEWFGGRLGRGKMEETMRDILKCSLFRICKQNTWFWFAGSKINRILSKVSGLSWLVGCFRFNLGATRTWDSLKPDMVMWIGCWKLQQFFEVDWNFSITYRYRGGGGGRRPRRMFPRLVLDCQHARRFLSEKLLHAPWVDGTIAKATSFAVRAFWLAKRFEAFSCFLSDLVLFLQSLKISVKQLQKETTNKQILGFTAEDGLSPFLVGKPWTWIYNYYISPYFLVVMDASES